MSGKRVLFYVQHLMGLGHMFRATRILKAMLDEGLEVHLVFGGEPIPTLATHGATVHQLPPLRAGEEASMKLVEPDGTPARDDYKAMRRDLLLDVFAKVAPDILITEAFPFGRRQMRFELVPLMEAARARPNPPVTIASIRDILQENKKKERDQETVDLVGRFFDHVFVHGDPGVTRIERTFPLAHTFADKVTYTGIVAPEPSPPTIKSETFDGVVSVGGGAFGHQLLVAAVKAIPLSSMRDKRWCIVLGIRHSAEARAEIEALLPQNAVLREFLADLPGTLAQTTLSVSRCGYNTVADIFIAGCRAVCVPLANGVETEQLARAALLEERGLAVTLDPENESPEALAAAIDRAILGPAPDRSAIRLDGARTTARLVGALTRGESLAAMGG